MTIPVDDNATIRIVAETQQLFRVRTFIRKQIAQLGFSEFEENNIVLAVDEACANLIQHAYYNQRDAFIDLRVIIEPGAVKVEISDNAAPFNPSDAQLPDMRQYFAEHRHHGLGILLMTRVMDEIDYQPAGSGSTLNTLILTKRRTH
ncbi:MAG: ATP-binding protein [Ignavibacteria bacterium]|nr:ATP-binding protein [Ignavibacteria bacterium]